VTASPRQVRERRGTTHLHVTVQSQSALDAATISRRDVPTSPGERLRIGDVDLEDVRVARPCKLLDEVIGTGARTALRRRAGSVCRALSSGSIADSVGLALPACAPAVDSAEHR